MFEVQTVRAFIDRIESGIASLLLGDDEAIAIHLPASLLPAGAREGMVLSFKLAIDASATTKAREDVQALLDELRDSDE